MTIAKIPLLLLASLFVSALTFGAVDVSAAEETAEAPVVSLKEMPLLRDGTWIKMSEDEKIAFVWGMGHVITMERERMERYPEMKKESFAVKMASGLAGMPMSEVAPPVRRLLSTPAVTSP